MLGPVVSAVRAMVAAPPEGSLRLVDDGDQLIAGGRRWTVHLTPGHSAGHISLWDATDATLLSGDHLLAEISPNPMVEPDAGRAAGRRRSLAEYLASLSRFAALDPDRVLPGHGPCFTGVPVLTAALADHHRDRADRILAEVRRLGTPTPYQLATRLFPDVAGFEVILALSEVVGHLDLLESEGRLLRTPGSPSRYAAA
jgi:glyoxylase-like metal-dependent hydrolase (beta-lactamase superfamily II)